MSSEKLVDLTLEDAIIILRVVSQRSMELQDRHKNDKDRQDAEYAEGTMRRLVTRPTWRRAFETHDNCANCHRCLEGARNEKGLPATLTRFIMCPKCDNKRCPKASDHRLDCNGSNEPGQEGSVYE